MRGVEKEINTIIDHLPYSDKQSISTFKLFLAGTVLLGVRGIRLNPSIFGHLGAIFVHYKNLQDF